MKPKEYMAILQVVSEVMGGAMHMVNADGITILYNEEMARLEKLNAADVLGKPFRSTFLISRRKRVLFTGHFTRIR